MTTDQLIQKALDGSLPLGLLTLVLFFFAARGIAKWAAANYWPKYAEWKEKKMAQDAAAEIRQSELIAMAFRQSADLHSKSLEQSAALHARSLEQQSAHELADERRHHALAAKMDGVVAQVKEDVACEIAASETRIVREVRRLAKENSDDIPIVPPARTVTGA
jgi:hypothetical protein